MIPPYHPVSFPQMLISLVQLLKGKIFSPLYLYYGNVLNEGTENCNIMFSAFHPYIWKDKGFFMFL